LDTLTEPAPLPADIEDRHEQAPVIEPDDGRGWLVLEPPRGWVHINWGELWRARELLYFLTWKDVKVRYKQTILGVLWALLQPVLTMLVFSVFFGRLAGLGKQTGDIPYPIFVYAGLLPWTFFANAVTGSSASVVGNTNLITKVYFPRLVIPLASVGGGLVDLAVSFTVLIGMMLFYHVPIQLQLAYVPLFLLGVILAATGVGALLAALTVSYRDFRYIVPFMMQIWMFLTPVIYPAKMLDQLSPKARLIYEMNPMSGLISGFRAAFLGQPIEWQPIGISLAASLALFLIGASYFRKVERRFADVI
jgi:lipopolysaccharide transport system permease protein